MKISDRNRQIEKVCEDSLEAVRRYGKVMAIILRSRILLIRSADSVHQLLHNPEGRTHPLKGNRKNQYAIDLKHPYRLIFEEKDDILDLSKSLRLSTIIDWQLITSLQKTDSHN